MIFCGVDPGLAGFVAFYTIRNNVEKQLATFPIPHKDKCVDALKLYELLTVWKPDRLILEEQFTHKNDKMGNARLLSYGQNWGVIYGIAQVLKIKTYLVLPNVWQSRVVPKSIFNEVTPKQRSFAAARKFFPQHTFKTDGESDASLLTLYGSLYCC